MGRLIRYGRDAPLADAVIDWGHPLADRIALVVSGGVVWLGDGTTMQVGLPGFHRHTVDLVAPTPFFTQRIEGTLCGKWAWAMDAGYGRNVGMWATGGGYLCIHKNSFVPPTNVYAGTLFASTSLNRFSPSSTAVALPDPSFIGITHNTLELANHFSLYGAGGQLVEQKAQGSVHSGVPTSGQILTSSAASINVEFIHAYNRALSAHEMAWLHDEPYAMFMLERRRTYYYPSTGIIMPIFSHHYRRNVGSRS